MTKDFIISQIHLNKRIDLRMSNAPRVSSASRHMYEYDNRCPLCVHILGRGKRDTFEMHVINALYDKCARARARSLPTNLENVERMTSLDLASADSIPDSRTPMRLGNT